MKFVVTCYGSRGDVEPSVVVGRELQDRGHDVRMAVPPNQVEFSQRAGLETVAYGIDTDAPVELQRNYWTCAVRTPWRIRQLRRMEHEFQALSEQCWGLMVKSLTDLVEDADLLFTGMTFEQPAANVAEKYGTPLATLDYYPVRANGQLLPFVPPPLLRLGWTTGEWLNWRAMKKIEDAERRQLGLPDSTHTTPRRLADRGALQIQAYEEVLFPGLANEWARFGSRRPFVGTLTLAASTDSDEDVRSWIMAGSPPVFFGFGTIAIASPAETLAMIETACAEIGVRALLCAGASDFGEAYQSDHVKVVSTVDYAKIFPLCAAVVHHGGAGTTAAGLRAGAPTVILWTMPDQPIWGAQLKRLKVGTARRLSATTAATLASDLRIVLDPAYLSRARRIAVSMSKPSDSARFAADLLENYARERSLTG